ITFPAQIVGTTSVSTAVLLNNTGAQSVSVQGVASNNPSEFTVTSSNCGTVLPAASCTVSVAFHPGTVGVRAGMLTVTSTGIGSPQSIALTGTGVTATTPPPSTIAQAIEYHHASFDHYFVTALADEISKLDGGVFVGWARTGQSFNVYVLGAGGNA